MNLKTRLEAFTLELMNTCERVHQDEPENLKNSLQCLEVAVRTLKNWETLSKEAEDSETILQKRLQNVHKNQP